MKRKHRAPGPAFRATPDARTQAPRKRFACTRLLRGDLLMRLSGKCPDSPAGSQINLWLAATT